MAKKRNTAPTQKTQQHQGTGRRSSNATWGRSSGPCNDPKTVEIMLNADGKLWLERLGEPMKCIGTLRVAQAQAIIETIAGYHGKEVTRSKPILEGELPLDGSASPASSRRLCPHPPLPSGRRPSPSSRSISTSNAES
jgi:Flp pilus assembly CpaF family ATPase